MFPEKFRMDGKVALITGAGRGIGLGMAEVLASAGCAIAIQDIEKDVAEEAAETIRKIGVKAISLGGDIGNLSLTKKMIAQTRKKLGGFHVLINNAAIQSIRDWQDFKVEEIERQFRATWSRRSFCASRRRKFFNRKNGDASSTWDRSRAALVFAACFHIR